MSALSARLSALDSADGYLDTPGTDKTAERRTGR